jgi:hypothetical protein
VARKKENWELWYPQSQEKEIFPGRFKYEEWALPARLSYPDVSGYMDKNSFHGVVNVRLIRQMG